jgi:predicted amidohydrolase YtcJ
MDAIDMALNGSENIQRHMIFHNHFLGDDLVDRYADSGILAIVEPARPGQAEYYAEYVGETNMRYFKRWKELNDLGVAVAGNSDWPYGSINPLRRLGHFVKSYVPVYAGRKDQALAVIEALKLLTIRAAYAMRNEDKTGSLNPGKLADIVVLSNNPLDTDPANMEDIKVMMTMVDGWVEYWNENLQSGHLSVKKFPKNFRTPF